MALKHPVFNIEELLYLRAQVASALRNRTLAENTRLSSFGRQPTAEDIRRKEFLVDLLNKFNETVG